MGHASRYLAWGIEKLHNLIALAVRFRDLQTNKEKKIV